MDTTQRKENVFGLSDILVSNGCDVGDWVRGGQKQHCEQPIGIYMLHMD